MIGRLAVLLALAACCLATIVPSPVIGWGSTEVGHSSVSTTSNPTQVFSSFLTGNEELQVFYLSDELRADHFRSLARSLSAFRNIVQSARSSVEYPYVVTESGKRSAGAIVSERVAECDGSTFVVGSSDKVDLNPTHTVDEVVEAIQEGDLLSNGKTDIVVVFVGRFDIHFSDIESTIQKIENALGGAEGCSSIMASVAPVELKNTKDYYSHALRKREVTEDSSGNTTYVFEKEGMYAKTEMRLYQNRWPSYMLEFLVAGTLFVCIAGFGAVALLGVQTQKKFEAPVRAQNAMQ